MNVFEEVRKLRLPLGKYLVLGSGILAALGIREAKDLDLLVTEDIFDRLRNEGWKYEEIVIENRVRQKLTTDGTEVFKDFWYGSESPKTGDLIAGAQVIDGIPFLSLQKLAEIKRIMGREKDQKDILLIEDYFAKVK